MSRQHSSNVSTGALVTGQVNPQRITEKLLATHGHVVGIEISSSGLRQSVALANLDGEILLRVSRPLEVVPDSTTVLQQIDAMIAEVTSPERLVDGRILRVGVAVGGLVDASQGLVRTLYHAQGWDNYPLQDYFTERLDAPCIIDNNANAAALAEYHRGSGVRERVVLYVGLGRGIGGGMVINGKVYHGVTSVAGEIGHILVKEGGPRCSCGGYGHLEAIASARAITGAMIEHSAEDAQARSIMERMTDGHIERLTPAQVFHLAAEGNQVARHIVNDVHTYLGIALANIVHVINPSMIILGGSVAQAGDLLVQPLEQQIQKLCLPEARRELRVVQGSLGVDANLMGAVTLALQDL
ncbi:ROK family protein [Ktedonospora formicarum]|uniref:ROK family protein n=1 Tax=Ktedonospora formicarum TaxID=2778364 RepID=UPI001C692DD4|nr:ROK family protein [Ktedonospora formicarum]